MPSSVAPASQPFYCANNACGLPSVSALVKYHHAAAGHPVKESQCQVITKGNCAAQPSLTIDAVRKFCPIAYGTILQTMSKKRKNISSTKSKLIQDINSPTTKNNSMQDVVLNQSDDSATTLKLAEIHAFMQYSSKIHLDQMGEFLYVAISGKQCLVIVHVVNANVILVTPFKSKRKHQLTSAHLNINKELNKREFVIDLNIWDNEVPELHRDATETEKYACQLVHPNIHCCYAAERAMHTFKEYFLRVLAGVDNNFPMQI